MTRFKFIILRFAQYFGAYNRNKHLNAAASEQQLLTQAFRYLGRDIWQHADQVSLVEPDYWTLKKLGREKAELEELLKERSQNLDETHHMRQQTIDDWKKEIKQLEQKRGHQINRVNATKSKVHDNWAAGKRLKIEFEGFKAKLEVLKAEQAEAEAISEVEERLASIKLRFTELKQLNDELQHQHDKESAGLQDLQDKIKQIRNSLKERASKKYVSIGQVQKENSATQSKIRQIEKEMARLHMKLAKLLLTHAHEDSAIKKLLRRKAYFIAQIRMLEKSIVYEQKLAKL